MQKISLYLRYTFATPSLHLCYSSLLCLLLLLSIVLIITKEMHWVDKVTRKVQRNSQRGFQLCRLAHQGIIFLINHFYFPPYKID